MEIVMVKTEVAINQQRIEDLLCEAWKGGSTYWAVCNVTKEDRKAVGADYSFEVATRGGKIEVYDMDTNEKLGVLNEEAIKKGLQLMADNFPKHFMDFLNENDDAETADVFMQLAVMGKITFG
jgi:hypothetical protein